MLAADYLGRDGVHMQQSELDCGVAVLEMVINTYGGDRSVLDSAYARIEQRNQGMTMREMKDVATAAGLDVVGLIVDGSMLNNVPTPFIAHFRNHYVVVDSVASGYVEFRDPAVGRLRTDIGRFLELWTGYSLVFSAPTHVSRPRAPEHP